MSKCSFSVFCLVIVTLAAVPVAAEEAVGAAEAAAIEQARTHFDAGIRAVRRELWDAALAEFNESMRHHPTAVAAYNVALCLRNLRRFSEALVALEAYVEQFRDEIDSERMEQVDQMRRELEALLTPVTLNVDVAGATITVDGRDVGTSPLPRPLQLVSGEHEIEIRHPDYAPLRRSVTVVTDRELDLSLELSRRQVRGSLTVDANVRGASVAIDGHEAGTVPFQGELTEGVHEVQVHADGYRSDSRVVTVVAGEESAIEVTLARSRARVHPAGFWSMVGLAGAGVVATSVFGALTLQRAGEYTNAEYQSLADQEAGERLAMVTDISLGVTAAAAIAAVVLAFFTRFSRPNQEPAVTTGSTPSLESAFGLQPVFGGWGGE